MNNKKEKQTLIGSIVSLVVAVIALIGRFALSSELNGIKKSGALIVISGSKEMTRSEYIEYATKLITSCTAAAVFLLILAAVLFVVYRNIKKRDA